MFYGATNHDATPCVKSYMSPAPPPGQPRGAFLLWQPASRNKHHPKSGRCSSHIDGLQSHHFIKEPQDSMDRHTVFFCRAPEVVVTSEKRSLEPHREHQRKKVVGRHCSIPFPAPQLRHEAHLTA